MPEQLLTAPPVSITTGNEIGTRGKFVAGILLVLFTVLPLIILIGYWPDKLSPASENKMLYENRIFHIKLIETDSTGLGKAATGNDPGGTGLTNRETPMIHLTTLLFLLVATAGFLGNMVHLATSLTNFVGSEKFKKSWILWYVIKPFTAAALAVIIYMVFRAGLLNFGDSTNINLYGLVILSALAGLFTDKATLKLEEIFTVIFQPKDLRPDKIDSKKINVKIKGIKPEQLLLDGENAFIITGEGMENKKLSIKINDREISNPIIKSDSIAFTYSIPEDLRNQNDFTIRVFDEEGNEIYNSQLIIQGGDLLLSPDNQDEDIEEQEETIHLIKG